MIIPSPEDTKISQAWGEKVARHIFPETTIVRPAPLFGFEDHFLHKLAGVTNLLTSNRLKQKLWPAHVSKPALCPMILSKIGL